MDPGATTQPPQGSGSEESEDTGGQLCAPALSTPTGKAVEPGPTAANAVGSPFFFKNFPLLTSPIATLLSMEAMDPIVFQRVIEETVKTLPDQFRTVLNDVLIVV